MNREQQIEEMSNIITEVAFVQAHELNGDENLSDIVATALYKAGYRHKKELTRIKKNYKIGLGKSQSWVKKLKNDKEQLESENFNLLRTIDTIREEMAEEIYKEARERVNEGIEWLNCSKDKPGKEYMKGVTFGLSLFNKALVNTIKKYGVEVLNEQEAKN